MIFGDKVQLFLNFKKRLRTLSSIAECGGFFVQLHRKLKPRQFSIFERLYLVYRIAPYGTARIRAVKKENKLYFWDWPRVPDPGSRFENMVAGHLLKYCHFIEDTEGHDMELRFVRDTDKREVDFVVLKDRVPLFAVECKTGERLASPHCAYFRERTNIPDSIRFTSGVKITGTQPTRHASFPSQPFAKNWHWSDNPPLSPNGYTLFHQWVC